MLLSAIPIDSSHVRKRASREDGSAAGSDNVPVINVVAVDDTTLQVFVEYSARSYPGVMIYWYGSSAKAADAIATATVMEAISLHPT